MSKRPKFYIHIEVYDENTDLIHRSKLAEVITRGENVIVCTTYDEQLIDVITSDDDTRVYKANPNNHLERERVDYDKIDFFEIPSPLTKTWKVEIHTK